jgi:bifunctional ADP-heptose synthase (sugar kinase/adenylyltransferase)
LDTRQKILSPEEIPARDNLTVIAGHFDPMTAAHARRINELNRSDRRIVVIVTDPPAPILPQRARAELVAALQAVDYVIAAMDNTCAEVIARLQPDEVIQEEAADLRRTQELIAHVRGRQAANEA